VHAFETVLILALIAVAIGAFFVWGRGVERQREQPIIDSLRKSDGKRVTLTLDRRLFSMTGRLDASPIEKGYVVVIEDGRPRYVPVSAIRAMKPMR
jgi:hypothetical protein